ncbi:MAG: DUF1549 domain-containing protein [Pirellulaceae bacterium]
MVRSWGLISIAAVAVALVSSAPAAEPAIQFLRDVKPILAQRCFRCHSSIEEESGLRLDSVAAILKGGDGGAVVVPGKSGDSTLISAVLHTGDIAMPPEGDPLTEAQIATLRAWVDAGAHAPAAGAESQTTHWSFLKPERPPVPTVNDPAWSANPIDAFIAAKHAELKLTPVGEAPQHLLLRRVYLDLIGLPPTPQELREFLADDSPDAYEKVVDRLLESPHYGERWGRHWMDVWRYSDWDGYGKEVRESQPHIWRWRDWIVESLNADKPYDRMVQEMLAADELSPSDPEALRATGYLARSWYKFNRNKWLDDAVEHTGKAFLGVTFNCCKCHDHMYDPLAQTEYFQMRAFFEPYDVRTDRVPGEANAEKAGLVRVFDAKAAAPTYLFVRGNEKEPLKDQPLSPALPKVFLPAPLAIERVTLPPRAYYQGLAPFVRDEARAAGQSAIDQAQSGIVAAQQALAAAEQKEAEQKEAESVAQQDSPKVNLAEKSSTPLAIAVQDAQIAVKIAEQTLVAADESLVSTNVRIAADAANYTQPPAANAQELSLAAGAAERQHGAAAAQVGLLQTQLTAAQAKRGVKAGDEKSTKAADAADKAVANAEKALAAAEKAATEPSDNYTRLTAVHPATSTGRRLALARWITSRDNPLAARVAINHIWLRHFDSPLVPSVFDFGLNGKPPTNQPLLDWLAVELMEGGWQMKPLHKRIVMSRTYRLASGGGQVPGSKFQVSGSERELTRNLELETRNSVTTDPENLYYWRANPRRLEAEAVRDATLHVAGSLDATRGGPELDPSAGLTVARRSIYFRASKEKKMQFLSLFDSANPVECYRRSESIAPQQALAMANSTLTLAQSRLLAKKLSDALGNDIENEEVAADAAGGKFVEQAFITILCREPTADELATCSAFLGEQAETLADLASLTPFSSGPAASVAPATDPEQRARENLVHVLLNHNDFVTVR